MIAKRTEVYNAIDSERHYQDNLPTTRTDGSDKTVGDYLTMIESYRRRANDAWTDNPGTVEALHVIRKIAGIAVRCMEEHGAPHR